MKSLKDERKQENDALVKVTCISEENLVFSKDLYSMWD